MDAVILDIDGTLLQSSQVDVDLQRDSIEAVVGRVRFRRNLEDYDCVRDTGILLQVLEDNAKKARSNTIDTIRCRSHCRLEDYIAKKGSFVEIPGGRGFVERLKKSEYHAVAFATGCWRFSAKRKLETAGFDISDIPLATVDDAIDRREIMRIALTSFVRDFETITYYGDGIWDKLACHGLGWTFPAAASELGGIQSYEDIGIA